MNSTEISVEEKTNTNEKSNKKKSVKKWRKIQAAVVVACALGVFSAAIGFGVVGFNRESRVPFSPPSALRMGKFKTAAISSDGVPCSKIGRDILIDGGNAIDAAIATAFCIGAVNPHSAGIGGGFLMTFYDPVSRKAQCLDAREVAPIAATEDMFGGNAEISQRGGLSVAVPGELAGYWSAHQKYGRLPWKRIVMPIAELMERGIAVNKHLSQLLVELHEMIENEPSLSFFINRTTGRVKSQGEIFERPMFAKTLRDIAENGVDIFYNGSLGDKLVEDVQKRGGILTKEDLRQYKPNWVEPITVKLSNNLTLYSIPPPGSGVLAAYVMNILDGRLVNGTAEDAERAKFDPKTYHRIVEAYKHAFAQRTKLADPRFLPEVVELTKNLSSKTFAADTFAKINDSMTSNDPAYYGAVTYNQEDRGTAHVSVLDGNGFAVALTSTINLGLGAGFASEQTGIILNDEMDDFSSPNVTNYFGVPPSPGNFIKPGKRPMSSMAPTIVTNSTTGRVRIISGSAGGTKITTFTAMTIIRNVWLGETIKEAVDDARMHHQLLPMIFQYEKGFPMKIVEELKNKGHRVEEFPVKSAIGAIAVEQDGYIYACADYRKVGDVAGI